MYGTIARYRVKPGKLDELIALTEANRPENTGGPGIMIVFQMDRDPNEILAVFASESREAYRAMSEDPATHELYLQMMEFMAAEPEWNDGEIIASEFDL
jgi:quinol monooxygenase YgiN